MDNGIAGDRNFAWLLGGQCLMYESSPGPERINMGAAAHPSWIDRTVAIRASFTQLLITKLDGDDGRIREAARQCQARLDSEPRAADEPTGNAIGADLCRRALRLLEETGATRDANLRRRIVEQCRHDTRMVFLVAEPGARNLLSALLRATLAVIDSEPDSSTHALADTIPFPGPSYDPATGTIDIGVDASGDSIHWQLHTPGRGVESGVIVGPRGCGKSTLVNVIILNAMASGVFVLILADPSGRKQLPGPFAKANYASAEDVDGTVRLLRGALAVADARSEDGEWTSPNREQPGLLVVVEECQHVFTAGSEATGLAEAVAVRGASSGVGLIVTAPSSDVAHFGGSEALRGALTFAGNAPAMGGPDALADYLAFKDARHRARASAGASGGEDTDAS